MAKHYRWNQQGLLVLGKIESLAAAGGGSITFPIKPRTLKYFTKTVCPTCSFPVEKGGIIHVLNRSCSKIQFSTSAVISVIGFVDSIVSAKEQSGKFGYSISPNRELVALGQLNIFFRAAYDYELTDVNLLGASNIASSFFPGLVSAFGIVNFSCQLRGCFDERFILCSCQDPSLGLV